MNKNIKSILLVTLSNMSTIISGILVGFLLPKIMPIESYGLYKTFTLYTSYVGLFSLGIIDGIVLRYGEKNYNEIDKEKFRSIFRWYCIVHALFALSIFIISMLIANNEYRFILRALTIYMMSNNITGYFQQISQITMRFKELSFRKILQSIFNIIIIIGLYIAFKLGNIINYHYYLVSWIIINIALMLWYIYTYRDIIFYKCISLKNTFKEIIELILIGFPLLFANLCSSLILALDRQFVNILFDTKTYAVYAFAYNILSLVTVATSAIATVIYPILKRTNEKNLKENYDFLISTILCFVFACMILYFPLSLFIKVYLPQYIESIIIFKIIFPGLAISSAITVIMHNYYKVFNSNMIFFKKSIVVLILSILANCFAYYFFKTTSSISIASIITMVIWYIYTEQFFVDKSGYKREKNLFYIIVMMSVYYVTTILLNEVLGGIIYILFYGVISYWIYKDKLFRIKKLFFNR